MLGVKADYRQILCRQQSAPSDFWRSEVLETPSVQHYFGDSGGDSFTAPSHRSLGSRPARGGALDEPARQLWPPRDLWPLSPEAELLKFKADTAPHDGQACQQAARKIYEDNIGALKARKLPKVVLARLSVTTTPAPRALLGNAGISSVSSTSRLRAAPLSVGATTEMKPERVARLAELLPRIEELSKPRRSASAFLDVSKEKPRDAEGNVIEIKRPKREPHIPAIPQRLLSLWAEREAKATAAAEIAAANAERWPKKTEIIAPVEPERRPKKSSEVAPAPVPKSKQSKVSPHETSATVPDADAPAAEHNAERDDPATPISCGGAHIDAPVEAAKEAAEVETAKEAEAPAQESVPANTREAPIAEEKVAASETEEPPAVAVDAGEAPQAEEAAGDVEAEAQELPANASQAVEVEAADDDEAEFEQEEQQVSAEGKASFSAGVKKSPSYDEFEESEEDKGAGNIAAATGDYDGFEESMRQDDGHAAAGDYDGFEESLRREDDGFEEDEAAAAAEPAGGRRSALSSEFEDDDGFEED